MTNLKSRLRAAEGVEAVKLTNRRQVLAWTMIGLFFVIALFLALFDFWGQAIVAWISLAAFWVASRIEAARHEISAALRIATLQAKEAQEDE